MKILILLSALCISLVACNNNKTDLNTSNKENPFTKTLSNIGCENTFSNVERRSEKQKLIDHIRHVMYSSEMRLDYCNNGEYDKYIVLNITLSEFVNAVHMLPNIDSILIEKVDTIQKGKLLKGSGKVEFFAKKGPDKKYYFTNGLEWKWGGSCRYERHENSSMEEYVLVDYLCNLSLENRKQIKQLIAEENLDALSSFFVEHPLVVVKFYKKDEAIDVTKLIDEIIQDLHFHCVIFDKESSPEFNKKYESHIKNKFGIKDFY